MQPPWAAHLGRGRWWDLERQSFILGVLADPTPRSPLGLVMEAQPLARVCLLWLLSQVTVSPGVKTTHIYSLPGCRPHIQNGS